MHYGLIDEPLLETRVSVLFILVCQLLLSVHGGLHMLKLYSVNGIRKLLDQILHFPSQFYLFIKD